jgi:glycerol-3-phosphate dehydrogenase subunit B
MMSDTEPRIYDVCIIGTGMSGMSAALFAANRGLSTALIGSSGEILFASGLLDLLGVHPIEEKKTWRDPLAGIAALKRSNPLHPYARLKKKDILTGFEELLDFLEKSGVPYRRKVKGNSEVPTALGTTKLTYGVPQTMWHGVEALAGKKPCLLVGILGLKGFSAYQVAATLNARWPELRSVQISFPGLSHYAEVYAERLARALELGANRKRFAGAVRSCLDGAKFVGFPPILGISNSLEIFTDLQNLIDVPIFEVPGTAPSVPGLRLKEAFERFLPLSAVRLFSQQKVMKLSPDASGNFILEIGRFSEERAVRSKAVILATGGFIGGGLRADRKQIRETLLGLPVYQPEGRRHWHREDFFDPRGHPINQSGLEIDDFFRPLDKNGRPAFQTLFAAGSILAHQDWMRMKCGAGLAIASAYAAVNSLLKLISF